MLATPDPMGHRLSSSKLSGTSTVTTPLKTNHKRRSVTDITPLESNHKLSCRVSKTKPHKGTQTHAPVVPPTKHLLQEWGGPVADAWTVPPTHPPPTHTHARARARARTHIHKHTHTCTHIHTHTHSLSLSLSLSLSHTHTHTHSLSLSHPLSQHLLQSLSLSLPPFSLPASCFVYVHFYLYVCRTVPVCPYSLSV